MSDQTIGRLAYGIDFLFILLAPLHPALIMLAVVLAVVRRWSWLCGGLLALAGQTRVTTLALILLPGAAAFMSSDELEDADNAPTTHNGPLPALQVIATPHNADQQRPTTPQTTPGQVTGSAPQLDRTYEDGLYDALLRLMVESRRKPFQNGVLPQARGIEVAFGVSRSSQPGSQYQLIAARLKTDLDGASAPVADAILGFTPDSRAIRQDSAGRVYIVGPDGARVELAAQGAIP